MQKNSKQTHLSYLSTVLVHPVFVRCVQSALPAAKRATMTATATTCAQNVTLDTPSVMTSDLACVRRPFSDISLYSCFYIYVLINVWNSLLLRRSVVVSGVGLINEVLIDTGPSQ